mmetsp:Transcript_3807/g.10827  ORF Transcript_3807/g.10827 Transcript_3807/m.10827 type:complete len:135 (-) Transcript_3807:90-494(-)|eukprot:CAMPEP_0117652500 /NCGR_PEP_ID=MMETSP0804-20121206/2662_1 /TAXON_ID=1074897 /ORGANISM="Tetraselmis astigmatica, Strain CCMP880" /LENGTH=134 /DNA_ID=CAMNT_0005458555 /DNA_START=193 /DNA_END=597 /DNA_ORIENTATION=+
MAARQATRLGAQIPGAIFTNDVVHYNPISFFRSIVREVPTIVTRYRLEELVTQRQMIGFIASMFRQNAGVKDQRAVDLLVLRGQEEFDLVMRVHKQRHHLIAQYVHEPQAAAAAREEMAKMAYSPFLTAFYKSN